MKFADRAYGLNTHPSQATIIQLNTVTSKRKVYLHKQKGYKNQNNFGGVEEDDDDSWIEIELGEFYVYDSVDNVVEMCLKEIESQHLRGGLVVEGIQLRPKLKL